MTAAEERRAQLNRINKVHSREADPSEPAKGAPRFEPGHVVEIKTGGYGVLSRSTPGAWWLVHGDTCSCPAGRNGAERCWHRAQVAAFCKALDAAMARPVAPVARRMLVEEPDVTTCESRGYTCCETLTDVEHAARYGYPMARANPPEPTADEVQAVLWVAATRNGLVVVDGPERRTCAQHGKRHTESECAAAVELSDAVLEAGDWL